MENLTCLCVDNFFTKKNMNKLNLFTKSDFLLFNNDKRSALFWCCVENKLFIIKYFINKFKITCDEIMNKNNYGSNCLALCCHVNNILILKYFINKYILELNINFIISRNVFGNNCIHFCCNNSKIKLLKYIINIYNIEKKELFIKNNIGKNVLYLCCENNGYKPLKYLIKKYKLRKNECEPYLNINNKYNKILSRDIILLIKNINLTYEYNKIFNLIYKKY